MRYIVSLGLLWFSTTSSQAETLRERLANDPMYERCVGWMIDGYRGGLIQGICLDEYAIPPPSLFMCARKISTGFQSPADRESCAIEFDEQAKRTRAGFVK